MPPERDPALIDRLRRAVRDVPDFPEPGILFKDITPILADAELFHGAVEAMIDGYRTSDVDAVVGIESRGFLLAAPMALRIGCAFVPVRKQGKLPYATVREEYTLEYGTSTLEAHEDAIRRGQHVLVVDDVLATGGTAAATAKLVERLGGELVGFSFLIALEALEGRERLEPYPVQALLTL